MNVSTPAIAGILSIVFCLWFLRFALNNLRNADSSKHWPGVQGHMVSVTLWGKRNIGGKSKDAERLTVSYRYEVDGKAYDGNRIAFYTLMYPETVRFAEDHPEKSDVSVFYDPENPRNAVLMTGARSSNKRFSEVILASFALMVSVVVTFMGLLGYLD
ncbi:DUF3592 domain-containing protein [Alteromonas sp. H39]|uniref:DUF3592 domain-containing protein n=1 Tax=Alteromonas sp. H39 TaxID=3389876 RepID=UPI0039DF799A